MNNINDLRNINSVMGNVGGVNSASSASSSVKANNNIGDEFAKLLKTSIEDLNQTQEAAEAAASDIATGQVKDLHQAAIAINKAETSMKFMLEVRNKAINAYKEISRTQI